MQNALTLSMSLDLKQQTTAYDVLRHLQSHFIKIPAIEGSLTKIHNFTINLDLENSLKPTNGPQKRKKSTSSIY